MATSTDAAVTVSARLVTSAQSATHHDATAIHLVINNRGKRPMRLGHAQLSLVTTGGTHYPALPLRRVPPTTAGRTETVNESLGSALNPQSHDRAAAANQANGPIQEGIVDPRERVEGMVYFDKAPAGSGRVRVVVRLVDARDHKPFGRVELPLPSVAAEQPPADSAQPDNVTSKPDV